jgi:hypothetical protein
LKASGLGGINSDISDSFVGDRTAADDFDLTSVLKALEEDDEPSTSKATTTPATAVAMAVTRSPAKAPSSSSNIADVSYYCVFHLLIIQ